MNKEDMALPSLKLVILEENGQLNSYYNTVRMCHVGKAI